MTSKPLSMGKTGAGAYSVALLPDGKVSTHVDGVLRTFDSVQDAYDDHRGRAADSHSDWNVCYALEDHMSAEAA